MAALADFLNNFATKNNQTYKIDSLNFFTVKFEFMSEDSKIKLLFDEFLDNLIL